MGAKDWNRAPYYSVSAVTCNDNHLPNLASPALGAGTGINLSCNAVAGSIGYAVDRSTDNINWTQIATPRV